MTKQSKIENGKSKMALLVLVHGSPRASANEPMYRVIDLLRNRDVYDIVEAAFLECNEPTIPEAIDSCVRRGAKRVVAVPYFLHTGNHVADDLPRLLEEAQARHPEVEFLMGDFIGRAPEMTEILWERALAARDL
jgi:sirohydrochlorin ferrochelatase